MTNLEADTNSANAYFYPKIKFYILKMAGTFLINAGKIICVTNGARNEGVSRFFCGCCKEVK